MANRQATAILPDETSTQRFGGALALCLQPGDTLLLSGDIGAGKSFLARAIIHALQDVPEDVPSPTYTLVQTYDTRAGELWHCDLYRVSSAFEIEELGLTDAFANAICLVEWPDRLGDLLPASALSLTLTADPTDNSKRKVDLAWSDPRWDDRIAAVHEGALP